MFTAFSTRKLNIVDRALLAVCTVNMNAGGAFYLGNEVITMAERRMFAKTIIDSDAFLDMPLSAQALYFHLSMRADDDGFVNNPKKIQRMIGASDDDCKLLVMKRFILTFESGVIVIKHWRIHNYIQKDRYKETLYKKEKNALALDAKNAYTEATKTPCIQNGHGMYTQDSIGKDSLEIEKDNNIGAKTTRFKPPTVEEVTAYCTERQNNVDPQKFVDYYTANGWQVGRNKMKDWKAAVRTWERNGFSNGNQKRGANGVLLDDRKTDELDGIL